MITIIKTLLKPIFYSIIDLIVTPTKKIRPKTLLIIRLDAIGDYILFRNFIEILRISKKYKGYKITLLGNSAWKSISDEFDSEYIDEFIWLDRNKFKKNLFYRYNKLQEIVSNGYEIVISSVYSRDFDYTDNIVRLIKAKEKIGSIGNLSNIKLYQKNKSDQYYTLLLESKNETMFEFERNKEFYEKLLSKYLKIQKPFFNLKPKKLNFKLPSNYAILFIGASSNIRKWSVLNFSQIAVFLKEKYGYEIVLCGGPNDLKDAIQFKKVFKGKFFDLVGKTTLVELIHIINSCNLLLTNETSAGHFAVSLDKENIFVLYNGNHYGRFLPYPKEISEHYHVIYHPYIEENLDKYMVISNNQNYVNNLDINEITVDTVKNRIDKSLLKNKFNNC